MLERKVKEISVVVAAKVAVRTILIIQISEKPMYTSSSLFKKKEQEDINLHYFLTFFTAIVTQIFFNI
jgi:hypothetical protein